MLKADLNMKAENAWYFLLFASDITFPPFLSLLLSVSMMMGIKYQVQYAVHTSRVGLFMKKITLPTAYRLLV